MSGVTTLDHTFEEATSFNGNLTNWDVAAVTSMNSTFRGASAFNMDISDWIVTSVTDMGNMFRDAIAFNQDLSSWDVGAVTDMRGMFLGATAFDQILCWTLNANVDVKNMFDDDNSVAKVKEDCQPCLEGEYRIDTDTCGTCPSGKFAAAPVGSGAVHCTVCPGMKRRSMLQFLGAV